MKNQIPMCVGGGVGGTGERVTECVVWSRVEGSTRWSEGLGGKAGVLRPNKLWDWIENKRIREY